MGFNASIRLNNLYDLCQSGDITERLQFTPEYFPAVENFAKARPRDKITLIQSVRGAGNAEPAFVQEFLDSSAASGKQVYIPKIYNYQEDQFKGIAICNNMRYAIENSGLVAIGYNPESEGSKVDYGMVLFNDVPVKVLNPDMQISDTIYSWMKGDRSNLQEFDLFLQDMQEKVSFSDDLEIKLEYTPRPDKDGKPQAPALSAYSAIILGMVFASREPFKIQNMAEVKAQAKLEDSLGLFKSYSKVALMLDQIHNPNSND